jgi:hypothetical protein
LIQSVSSEENGDLVFGGGDGTKWIRSYIKKSTYQDDKWHFICCIKSEKFGIVYYLDGNEVTRVGNLTQNIDSPEQFNLRFGNDNIYNDRFFNGCLDDIRIYNRALPPEEISLLYKEY